MDVYVTQIGADFHVAESPIALISEGQPRLGTFTAPFKVATAQDAKDARRWFLSECGERHWIANFIG